MKLEILTLCILIGFYMVWAKAPTLNSAGVKKTQWLAESKTGKVKASEGSGQVEEDDDERYDDYEGSSEGSGETSSKKPTSSEKSSCLKLLETANSHKMVGAFVPRCTFDGAFEPLQCHGVTGECWCSDRDGRKIPGTIRKEPDMPKCDNLNSGLNKNSRSGHKNLLVTTKKQNMYFLSQTNAQVHHKVTTGSKERIVIDSIEVHENSAKSDGKEIMVPYKTVSSENNIKDARKILRNKNVSSKPDSKIEDEKMRVYHVSASRTAMVMTQPGILAGIICAGVVLVLCFVTFVTFIAYKLRRKSYYQPEEKPKKKPSITSGCNTSGGSGYGDIYSDGFRYSSSPAKYQTGTKMSPWPGVTTNNSLSYSFRQDRELYG